MESQRAAWWTQRNHGFFFLTGTRRFFIPQLAESEHALSFALSSDQAVLIAAARQMTTIPAQFEQTLFAVPDKAAIFSGSESLTFRQLHAEATAAAQALASLGVLPGDRVGICM